MEVQKVPSLYFEELGLVSGVVIPQMFKVPTCAKYDRVSCPKRHPRSYVRKIQPHTADGNLWLRFFQDSLSGTQLEWFYQLEGTNIRNWEDLAAAFYKQFQYNVDLVKPVHNFRACLWVLVRDLKIMPRYGETLQEESSLLCLIGSW